MKTLMTIPGPGGKKKKPQGILGLVVAILLAAIAYAAFFALAAVGYEYPLVTAAAPPTSPRGGFHVHSTISHDGRATPEEIAAAARAAGLHFVVLNDHNPETLGAPRYVSGVLLIFAQELSTPHGHVLALGTSRALTKEEREQDVFGAIASLGGHAILAHPAQQKNPWRDWPNAGKAKGLELYSADSMFRDAQRSPFTQFIPAAAAWVTNSIHGQMAVVREQPEAMARLLELASQQPYVGLCAHDAHGYPSYESEFRTLALYLPPLSGGPALPPDPVEAQRHVVEQIAGGQAWCAFHGIAAGDGFAVLGADGAPARTARVNDVLTVQLPSTLPPELQVRVFGAGTLGADGRTVTVSGPGAVQVEVWAKLPGMYFQDGWKPWLVPSPIRVEPSAGAQEAPVAGADGGGGG